MKYFIFFILLFSKTNYSYTQKLVQYYGSDSLLGNLFIPPLLDQENQIKFELDSNRIFIRAYNCIGKELWKTDPWKDNKIEFYKLRRPTIIQFGFKNNERTNFKKAIWIVYDNTQFGIIEICSGKYTFFGQD